MYAKDYHDLGTPHATGEAVTLDINNGYSATNTALVAASTLGDDSRGIVAQSLGGGGGSGGFNVTGSIGAGSMAKYYEGMQPYAPPSGPAWQTYNKALLASASQVPKPSQWSTDPYSMTDYDAVNVMALAMLAAKSTSPAVFNKDIMTVTAPGSGKTVVTSFAAGKAALAAGKQIQYVGAPIDQERLLKYIIGFREHNEFHEQCVERIFTDILRHCKPQKLAVYARYTRRGGLDINPWRSNFSSAKPPSQLRNARQ